MMIKCGLKIYLIMSSSFFMNLILIIWQIIGNSLKYFFDLLHCNESYSESFTT